MDATACTSKALVYFLVAVTDTARSVSRLDFGKAYLKKLALLAVGILNASGGGHSYLRNGQQLSFDAAGTCNLQHVLSTFAHQAFVGSFKQMWDKMKDMLTQLLCEAKNRW